MYINRLKFKNVGPIKDVDIKFDVEKTPKPILFVGKNGSGKSTIISNIVDSIYEIARTCYNNAALRSDEFEYQYFKSLYGLEISIGQDYMYSYIEYKVNMSTNENKIENAIQYIYKNGNISLSEFEKQIKSSLTTKIKWDDTIGLKKIIKNIANINEYFDNNVFCYFEPDRYSKPVWLGNSYYEEINKNHFTIKQRYTKKLYNPISVKNDLNDLLSWLLDVIADSRSDVFYNDKGKKISLIHTNNDIITLNVARKNIERIMSTILGEKVYFGLNDRSFYGARFNINSESTNKRLVNSLDSLSTGQLALFNIFASIIKYADNIKIKHSINIEEITGIVIIDEIELHLHSSLQCEILPKLLKLFPNIQFFITTHSPLFILGMKDIYGDDGFDIYQMPDADRITAEEFSEFQYAFDYMKNTSIYLIEIDNAIRQKQGGKTLIITEGATDWRHMKAALRKLKENDSNYENLDIDFLEYNSKKSEKSDDSNDLVELEMGDNPLIEMCRSFSKVLQKHKYIFISDADKEETRKKLNGIDKKYKPWGNNVFSIVLPIPEHRKNTPDICIEHYYTDEIIKTEIKVGDFNRRLFIGNEFSEDLILKKDNSIICSDKNSCGPNKINIIDGQSGKKVYRTNNPKNNLALSKMAFAEAIYKQKPEFANIDFSSFKLLFDVIKEIEEIPLETKR